MSGVHEKAVVPGFYLNIKPRQATFSTCCLLISHWVTSFNEIIKYNGGVSGGGGLIGPPNPLIKSFTSICPIKNETSL